MWKPQTKEAVLREIKIREWRKRTGKAIMAALSCLVVSAARGLNWLVNRLKWQSSKLAFEIETGRLISQRYDKLLQLGETVYAMYRSGQTSWRDIEPLCREIEQIEEKLDATKTKSFQVLPYEHDRHEELTKTIFVSQ